jgi:hypothetical protein
MPQPTAGDVYVNAPLTNVSLAYYQDQKAFIADRMFPVVSVAQQSGLIWEWDLQYILRNGMKPRAEGTESEGIGSKLNQKNYFAIVTALHKNISDQRRANEMAPINADRNATTQLSQQAVQYREITIKTAAFGTGKWTGMADQAGVAGVPGANQFKQWDQPTSDPVADVTAFKQTMLLATGVETNALAMGRQVWDKLKTNASIMDRLKFFGVPGSPTQVTLQAVATLFGVEEVLVSSVVQQTSNEGAATPVNGFVIGKELLLFARPPAPDVETPSAGYTFAWAGMMGANAYGARIKRIRMEHLESDRIEIQQAFDQKVLSPPLGGYASAVVA